MSYRTIKRVLGETSLERKCRFLFGGGLMLLITGSFYFYAQLNLRFVREQNRERARLLIAPNLLARHSEHSLQDRSYEQMFTELKPLLQLTAEEADAFDYAFTLYKPVPSDAAGVHRPTDVKAVEALGKIRNLHARGIEPQEIVLEDPEAGYQFFGAVLARKSCVSCHHHRRENPGLQVGDLMGVAHVTFPLAATNREIARNNAILIAMAIVTAFLAMLAAYAIVRYVIVKPVLHLKDVSDSIAHGELDQRADIRTGDEFEELSHAFNRMLRHLLTLQDELRQVNANLDAKVDELAQANLSLHEMNKLKSEFLATMSHELRTPLNSILGFSEVLAGASNLHDKQRRFLGNIMTSGNNLLSLIDDILDLAKIEAGKMDLHLAEFPIADLVGRLVASIRPLAERKNIELKWTPEDDLPVVYQDPGKLQQVLYNLLSNAVKFTPEGGRIVVQVIPETEAAAAETEPGAQAAGQREEAAGQRAVGGSRRSAVGGQRPGIGGRAAGDASADGRSVDWVSLVVADNGIGIPLEDQETIFEKFRQGRTGRQEQDTLTREFEGTGLGLSIVKELSKLLGGEVLLESEFGKGSTFTVRIPQQLHPALDAGGELPSQTIDFQQQITDRLSPRRTAPPPPAEERGPARDAG